MFLGQYRHSIDSKGRLIVPARFRDLLEDGAYIAQGFDRNLMVLTATAFHAVSERVNRMSLTDETARQLRRLIFSTADRASVDRTGRIRVPQFLLEIVGFETEAVIVGVGDYFEIWTPLNWEAQTDQLQDADANAQRFAALDVSTGQ